MEEPTVLEQTTLALLRNRTLRRGPLNASPLVEHQVVVDARDVARTPCRQALEDLEHLLGRPPLLEQLAATPRLSDETEDGEVRQGLSRRLGDALHQADAALRVDERA